MSTTENNNLSELNNILFNTLRGVEQGTVDEKKAQTIANLGNTIINNAKTQLQGYKLTGGRTSITALPQKDEKTPLKTALGAVEAGRVGFGSEKIKLPKNTYDRQMMFAETLGYKSPADAIGEMGKKDFLDKFYVWERANA